MILSSTKPNDASSDQKGKVAFYVLLWKRDSISLGLFDNYWKDVHGPVCARLPGQYQYWQFHVAHDEGGFFPEISGLDYRWSPEDNFDGIAELTFESEADRQTWFQAAGILMDDEHNLFKKAIGYSTSYGNSITYHSALSNAALNGQIGAVRFHVLVKKADGVSLEEFQKYLKDTFATQVSQSDALLEFRLHLFDQVDNSRADAPGVSHYEPLEKQYHAAYRITFNNHLERERFFNSPEYTTAIKDAAKYIKQVRPFPERTAYTFVHNGKMTLAGQRSAKVADLISQIGAANQLKEDITSLMLGNEESQNGHSPSVNGSSSPKQTNISQYLQGVQHFGITVNNLDKAIEFYVDVLGGKIAIGGDGFFGEDLHNLIFQKEDLEAASQGIDPRTMGVPNIKDGQKDALDVRFIAFGNTCIEIIHFRDAKLNSHAPNLFGATSSGVGHTNSSHISFYVKDDVDLNEFAKLLEEECHRRGMTNVVANRTVNLTSEEQRAKAARLYAKTEFPGDFDGWALFYCKGPNGEQLEFNQVTKKAKENFTRAHNEYNVANGTNYSGPNGKTSQSVELSANYTVPVQATLELVWQVLLDKFENPGNYMPSPVDEVKVLERYPDGVLREIKTPGLVVTERVTIDHQAKKITYDIVNYPLFKPTFINQVSLPENGSLPLLTNIFLLKPLTDDALEQQDAQHFVHAAQPKLIEMATLHLKNVIEQKSKQQENPMTQAITTSAGPKSEIVRQMFLAGESMNVDNFVKFYTEDAHYQFSNFPVAYGPQGIKDTSAGFLATVAKVYHHITKMWEQGDTVICEMEVTYIRHDGKVFRLPCCDTIVFKGDKVQELRIYMDISPVFQTAAIEKAEPVTPSGNLSARLGKMYEALHASNWDEFKTFFTPDLLYKIGANDPVIGPDACANLLQHIYQTLKLTTHNTRGMWEIGNTIILEMDANYVHKAEKRFVQVPCTDIYRFDGDKIYEWRVYPDASRTNIQL